MTDPIADYLTRLRNAIKAQHRVVEIPASNLKKEITKILFEQGYILNYKFIEGENPAGTIKIAPQVRSRQQGQRYQEPEACISSGSAPVHRLQRYAPRVKRSRHRNPVNLKRRHDQQESQRGKSRWRGSFAMFTNQIGGNYNVKNR